jgi:hypothetical protein
MTAPTGQYPSQVTVGGVDAEQVAAWLEHGRSLLETHHEDCECSWCDMAATDRLVAAHGLDPSRYWVDMPRRGGGYRAVPWWHTKPYGELRFRETDLSGFPPGPYTPHVIVDDIGAGLWCTLTGTDRAGNPLTVTGGVVGGPDDVGGVLAVRFRPYDGGRDSIVYVQPGTVVDFGDDSPPTAAQLAHVLDPGFPAAADRVELRRRTPARRKGARRRWKDETLHDVDAAGLAGLIEPGRDDVELVAVHHSRQPVMFEPL